MRSVIFLAATVGTSAAGDPPAAPPVSKFAPAADLAAALEKLVDDCSKATASADSYKNAQTKVRRDAHSMLALAQCLGLHDEDHPLKAHAPAIAAAASQLAAAKSQAEAAAGAEAVKAALDGKGPADAPALKWEKLASQGQLMKQVTSLNSRLKRGVQRFDRQATEIAQLSALMAAIAQVSVADTHEVKDPQQVGRWYELCGQWREACGALNTAAHAADLAAAKAAIERIETSCKDCHAAFRVEDTE
ncbi:MAG: hypothetical protein K1X74_19555 [Pirellulales bacterium]|nr:hypothetical protein [Pirellulales bacterium]